MITSEVSICNIALGHIGSEPIAALDEESQEARYCNIFWDASRDAVLRSYDWSFADAKILGASVDVPEVEEDLWSYAYTYPVNCLTVRHVFAESSSTPQDFKLITEIQASGAQRRLILTNIENAVLNYTVRVEDTNMWDAEFIEAMAYVIASKIAIPITKNAEVASFYNKKAREVLPQAKRADFKENKTTEVEVSPWETARLS